MRLWMLGLLLMGACRYSSDVGGPDADGDGYGEQVDCDDDDASVHPGATEVPYNGVDDDCDPDTPDDDIDGDGYGQADDCDDTDPTIHPDAVEVCDGIDNDCSGEADDAIGDTWYVDADGDGWGDDATASQSCDPAQDMVDIGGDCADDNGAIHPGATEQCDDTDWNCDGFPKRFVPGADSWYADIDDDGYGDPDDSITSCEDPGEGWVANADDCNDDPEADGASTYPGADELCDDADNDCDGTVDEDATDQSLWYFDHDDDDHGDPSVNVVACDAPSDSWVADGTDCDDFDPLTYPGADELCDGKDNDCDEETDEGAPTTTWYADDDGDGFGDPADDTASCPQPAGYVANNDDCNDDDTLDEGDPIGASAFPGNDEICDDLDNDCNGVVDDVYDAADGASLWFADDDGDEHGDPAIYQWACDAPPADADSSFEYVANATDCNDDPDAGGADIHPGADETCNDTDDDCNGVVDDIEQGEPTATTYYLDADGDGWGTELHTTDACSKPDDHEPAKDVGDGGDSDFDCDDLDDSIFPGADEGCDGLDRNCDGEIDGDDDGDGWIGVPASADCAGDDFGTDACDCPSGFDCDDADSDEYPGSSSSCTIGDSCLDGHLKLGLDTDGFYYIDKDPDQQFGSPREVYCDMTDDGDRPGAGWTLIYPAPDDDDHGMWEDFCSSSTSTCDTADPDGWVFTVDGGENFMPAGTAAQGMQPICDDPWGYILGEFQHDQPSSWSNDQAWMAKAVDTIGVAHDNAHVELTYLYIDDWEDSDEAFLEIEGDEFWLPDFHSVLDDGSGEICGDSVSVGGLGVNDWATDLAFTVSNGTTPDTVSIIAGATTSADDEGFGIDDVAVWVK